MLKNSKVVLFVTLKSWSGGKIFGPYYVNLVVRKETARL